MEITIFGKLYSKETILARKFLEDNEISYEFVDIEFKKEIIDWIKSERILSIPIIKICTENKVRIYVGFDKEIYKTLLDICQTNTNTAKTTNNNNNC